MMPLDDPIDIGRDDARAKAVHELLKPIYHRDDPTWFDRARDWFLRLLARLLDKAVRVAPGGPWGLLVIVVVILALLALALWFKGAPGRTHTQREVTLLRDDDRSADEMRRAADLAAKAGDWNLALQERFRAIIRGLEERTIIDRRPGWTADEAAAAAGEQLEPLTDELMVGALLFSGVTYGGRRADAATEGRIRELDRAAQRTAPRRRAGVASTMALPR